MIPFMALKISRILHAGYVFECDKAQIAFDPIFENPFSRNCHAFPNVQFDQDQIRDLRFQAVFISHFHDDHCSLESLNLLDRGTPLYIYCVFDELFSIIKELGFQNVRPLQMDVPVRVGAFEIIPRKALDADVDSLFHVKAQGLNVLNVVDSWIDPSTLTRLAESSPWDLVLWPFQTMRELEVLAPSRALSAPERLPEEWIEQLEVLNPRYVVPSSCQFLQEPWSWYNQAFFPISYRQFQQEVESVLPNSRVVRLNPSVSVTLSKTSLEPSSPLAWVMPVGEQNVDYQHVKELKPPPTSEISRYFPALSQEETERVLEYCRSGLLEKYVSMEAPLDPYFKKPRLWRLSLYDHQGEPTHFHYRIESEKIQPAHHPVDLLSWTTEIPIARFHGALERGETLTSLYMRINDMIFDPDTERDIQDVDLIEDPLIRCLFSGVFGAYQIAQLKRLMEKPTS